MLLEKKRERQVLFQKKWLFLSIAVLFLTTGTRSSSEPIASAASDILALNTTPSSQEFPVKSPTTPSPTTSYVQLTAQKCVMLFGSLVLIGLVFFCSWELWRIQSLKKELNEKNRSLENQKTKIDKKDKLLQNQINRLERLQIEISEKNKKIDKKDELLQNQNNRLERLQIEIGEKNKKFQEQQNQLKILLEENEKLKKPPTFMETILRFLMNFEVARIGVERSILPPLPEWNPASQTYYKTQDGDTIFHLVLKASFLQEKTALKALDILLERNLDQINEKNQGREYPLYSVFQSPKSTEWKVIVLKKLLKAGAKPNLFNAMISETVMHLFLEKAFYHFSTDDQVDILKALLQAGADFNLKDLDSGETPMHKFLKTSGQQYSNSPRNLLAILEVLRDKINPNLKTFKTRKTCLHILLEKESLTKDFGFFGEQQKMMKVFLSQGADPFLKDDKDNTATHMVAGFRHALDYIKIIHQSEQQKAHLVALVVNQDRGWALGLIIPDVIRDIITNYLCIPAPFLIKNKKGVTPVDILFNNRFRPKRNKVMQYIRSLEEFHVPKKKLGDEKAFKP